MDTYTRFLWWIFGSSAGALSRIRIVSALREQPRNAFQLAEDLHLDYSTVRHHLRVMESNRLVEAAGPRYGKVYTLSQSLEDHWPQMEEIIERSKRK